MRAFTDVVRDAAQTAKVAAGIQTPEEKEPEEASQETEVTPEEAKEKPKAAKPRKKSAKQ